MYLKCIHNELALTLVTVYIYIYIYIYIHIDLYNIILHLLLYDTIHSFILHVFIPTEAQAPNSAPLTLHALDDHLEWWW